MRCARIEPSTARRAKLEIPADALDWTVVSAGEHPSVFQHAPGETERQTHRRGTTRRASACESSPRSPRAGRPRISLEYSNDAERARPRLTPPASAFARLVPDHCKSPFEYPCAIRGRQASPCRHDSLAPKHAILRLPIRVFESDSRTASVGRLPLSAISYRRCCNIRADFFPSSRPTRWTGPSSLLGKTRLYSRLR
mgnify:CR=1 FL=1